MSTNYKLDPRVTMVYVAIAPLIKNGEPRTTSDGTPLSVVSCIIPPTEEGEKLQSIEVRVPSPAVAKDLMPYSPVRFSGLQLRTWEFNGRSGVTLSADSVAPATPAKGDR